MKKHQRHIKCIMSLSLALLSFAVAEVSAAKTLSSNAPVKFDRTPMLMYEIMSLIEDQTGYLFLFSEKEVDLKETIEVQTNAKPLKEVLGQLFGKTEIMFTIGDEYISLRKRTVSEQNAYLQQQGRRVTGTVKDVNGEPVMGASVVEKGTTNGTATDHDGNFTLNVGENATLQIHYLGFKSLEISDLRGGGVNP